MKRISIAAISIAAIATLSLATPAVAAPVPTTTTAVRQALHYLNLSKPISLGDAERLPANSSEPVVGYRYENPGVVGEYFTDSQPTSRFLAKFRKNTGSAPRVVQLITAPQVATERQARALNETVGAYDVPASIHTYMAPEGSGDMTKLLAQHAEAQKVSPDARSASGQTPISW